MESPTPIAVEPRAVELIWGGTRLRELLGRDLPVDRRVGETWEVYGENLVRTGPFAGRSLAEAARSAPEALLGRRVVGRLGGAFPLLVKFIDAAEMLSVQVHPDDEYAAANEDGCGKAEAYYVLEARPGSRLYYGLTPGTDRAALEKAIADGTIERLLGSIEVRAGDVVYTPAGTVHAFGAGLVFYELQQCSTITYRLYDWGRLGPDGRPRDLHIERALDVIRLPQPAPRKAEPLAAPDEEGERLILMACPHFVLEALDAPGASTTDAQTFHLLTSLGGEAEIVGERFGSSPIPHGTTLIVPAIAGRYQYAPAHGGRLLRSYVPDLSVDVVEPLRRMGHVDERIALLGDTGAD